MPEELDADISLEDLDTIVEACKTMAFLQYALTADLKISERFGKVAEKLSAAREIADE